ncbi:MAG TPA: hypothetical protein DGN60_04815 [Chloroflexi bacterium]|nr:hypothetical protein [Chloroflexota bacterium]|tara:strand:+ start:1720 stop:2259 length:540 start_codon:yes stop_codon:yes gene_type:complete
MSANHKKYMSVYSHITTVLDFRPIHLAVTEHGAAMLRYGITQDSFVAILKDKFSDSQISINTDTHIVNEQIDEYLQESRKQILYDLDLRNCSKFQRLVLNEVLHIPYGQTRTYKSIGQSIDNPQASRAIGGALANNPLPIIVPCHRVINTNGNIGGYLGYPHNNKKIYLLQLERNRLNA